MDRYGKAESRKFAIRIELETRFVNFLIEVRDKFTRNIYNLEFRKRTRKEICG